MIPSNSRFKKAFRSFLETKMNASEWPVVIIESPFAGDMIANAEYLKRACLDCLARHEVPFASHGFFPHFLNELDFQHRELGLTAGYAFWELAVKIVFYRDRGVSSGMQRAYERAAKLNIPTEDRFLTGEQDEHRDSESLPADVPTQRDAHDADAGIARDDWQDWPQAQPACGGQEIDPLRPDHPPAKDRQQES